PALQPPTFVSCLLTIEALLQLSTHLHPNHHKPENRRRTREGAIIISMIARIILQRQEGQRKLDVKLPFGISDWQQRKEELERTLFE
ncbi:MAG: hypothetical protein AAGJ35_06630, partial [Myxococcota bacterium]